MKQVIIALISRKHAAGKTLSSDDETEYLLIKSKKDFGEFTGFWYPPGGHVEAGETEEKALMRELKEELDLEIRPVRKITESAGDVKDQITHWWACDVVAAAAAQSGAIAPILKINNTEIADADWFTEKEIRTMQIWPATKRFFEGFVFGK